MVEDHFLTYLTQTTTPERRFVFEEAILILRQAGFESHVYLIDEMMEQDDMGDAGDFLGKIERMLNEAIHQILRQFGVTLDEDCSLVLSTDIFKALLAMDNWNDPDSLSTACEQEETAEVILATLLGLTGAHEEPDYLPHLARVSPDLIQRIDDVNQTFPMNVLPSEEERDRAHARLKAFFEAYSAPIFTAALSDYLLIGGDYHALIEPYEEKVSNLEKDAAINELVGFALASDLPNGEALQKAITKECQGWWDGQTTTATHLTALIHERLAKAHAL